MEELQTSDLEELVQELEQEYGTEELLSPEAEELLQDLHGSNLWLVRRNAAEHLGELGESDLQIVQALLEVGESDSSLETREAALESPRAPVHQKILQEYPDLMRRAQSAAEQAATASRALDERGEAAPEDSESPDAEELLRDLQRSNMWLVRRNAAEHLGELSESDLQIVQALLEVGESDSSLEAREAAVESLRAPVHQEILQEYPDLMRRAQSATDTRPDRFRVKTQASTLRYSRKAGALQRAFFAGLTCLGLLVFGRSFNEGDVSEFDGFMLALGLTSGYVLVVVCAKATTIVASTKEWIIQRGSFPVPSRGFRLDPAAYREIWAERVEKERGEKWRMRPMHRDDLLDDLLAALLDWVERDRVPRITYTLYARAKDGTDKPLLTELPEVEAEYLRRRLQNLLDAGGGLPATE